jgi:hypothetical protein
MPNPLDFSIVSFTREGNDLPKLSPEFCEQPTQAIPGQQGYGSALEYFSSYEITHPAFIDHFQLNKRHC